MFACRQGKKVRTTQNGQFLFFPKKVSVDLNGKITLVSLLCLRFTVRERTSLDGQICGVGDGDEDMQTVEFVLGAETELVTCPKFPLIPGEAAPELSWT